MSAGDDQGSCQGLSHARLSWRCAWAGEGHGWLVQAEGVDLGSSAQGWAPKVSVDETPRGVEFAVEGGPGVRRGPEEAGEGAGGGELTVGWALGPEPGLRM